MELKKFPITKVIKFKDSPRVYNAPVLVFDIDNTLYRSDVHVQTKLLKKSYELLKYTGMPYEKFCMKFMEYVNCYGSPAKGFYKEFKFDVEKMKVVNEYRIDLSENIGKNEELKKLLNSVNLQKFCFTNSNYVHACGILENIGLGECFDGIFHSEMLTYDYLCKPDVESYRFVENALDLKGSEILFYDDSVSNVEVARRRGWNAYLVGDDGIEKLLLNSLKEIGYF